jgi:hypothetical protein
VYYDETNDVWRKADSSNTDYSWYNYTRKKWANAVTVFNSGYCSNTDYKTQNECENATTSSCSISGKTTQSECESATGYVGCLINGSLVSVPTPQICL